MLNVLGGTLSPESGIDTAIYMAVIEIVDIIKLFTSLDTHMMEVPATDNHVIFLVKTIATCYAKI